MTRVTDSLASVESPAGMRFLPGGEFTMGSKNFYPEEAPLRRVRVDPFWIDATPVTNRDFQRFVDATGYVTTAETAPEPRDSPGMLPRPEEQTYELQSLMRT